MGKLSVCLLLVIFLEGLISAGDVYNWKSYGAVSWITQACLIMFCVWVASMEWDSKED